MPARIAGKNFKSLRYPLWTQNKARLIQGCLQLFEYITHHGTYVDGFAAPQDAAHPDMWAAKLVLEMVPKWFRDFWLCDIDPEGIGALKALQRVLEPNSLDFILSEPIFRPVIKLGRPRALVRRHFLRVLGRYHT